VKQNLFSSVLDAGVPKNEPGGAKSAAARHLARYLNAVVCAGKSRGLMFRNMTGQRGSAACVLVFWVALAPCTISAAAALSDSDAIMLADFADSSGATRQRGLREALRAALDESPYLNLVPDAAIERARGASPDSMPARELLRVCRTLRARAYVSGTLAQASQGSAFRGQLQTIDCISGVGLAHEEFTAETEELVDALGSAAGRMRLALGEPRSSVERYRTSLSQATSASFGALDAWSTALLVWRKEGAAAAVPLLQKAIDADPAFAAATYDLGLAYRNSGQEERARELFTRAFAAREHASTRKRLNIAAQYHAFVTVDEPRAVESFRAWIRMYPRDYKAVSNLGSFYGDICRYSEAIAQFERARRMNPSDVVAQEDLMEMLTATGEFNKARAVYRDIVRLKLDDDSPHLYLYVLAALESDRAEMAAQSAWFEGKKDLQHEILSEQADAAAASGHLTRARELTEQAVGSALDAGDVEQAAAWSLNAAWREELFGNPELARAEALRGLTLAPASREGEATAAIILARAGDSGRANSLVADIELRYPNHSVMQSYWLPTIRAQIALEARDARTALAELHRAEPLDLLYPQVFFYSLMPSVVLRAEAYMLAGEPARAVEQWGTILQNPGIAQLSATVPFARLQRARSYAASTRGAPPDSRAAGAYREFLRRWDTADPGIPLLTQARAELAQLQ
jgi:eukaryotic-like serine/threonine-protein kinase